MQNWPYEGCWCNVVVLVELGDWGDLKLFWILWFFESKFVNQFQDHHQILRQYLPKFSLRVW